MTLLEAMQSGKKFRRSHWDPDVWVKWDGVKFVDSFGNPEEIMNHGDDKWEFYQEPLIWEREKRRAMPVKNKKGLCALMIPGKFLGKKLKVRIEEIK